MVFPSTFALPNVGVYIPDKELIIFTNKKIIEHRKTHGKIDPFGIRSESDLDYLSYKITNHKYKNDSLENTLYVSTEILFVMACKHPFLEGNKTTGYSAAILILELNLSNYVNIKTGKNLKVWKPKTEEESEKEGKIVQMIASWGEGGDYERLKKQLFDEGILGKSNRKPNEEDVRKFIKKFLFKYIIE